MSKKITGHFDDLIEMASEFVQKQKGVWDHTAWTNFLAEAKTMGYEVNDELKSYLGTLLDSMKRVYNAAAATESITKLMSSMAENTVDFMKKTKGVWDHDGWQSYLKDIQKKGLDLNDETTKYLGGVLEASKDLYAFPPIASKMMAKATKKSKEA
ncbi:MAG: hypothetical protein HQK88_02205 [Nitrospirae bacterium]|nr:hypothetical protein [Nitrospirota bacterium]MBF0534408.1 hypothetical protein [Nitrospirota bacterium]MBF0615611.1 hypothetical protein [Nitrospirota bacterium]